MILSLMMARRVILALAVILIVFTLWLVFCRDHFPSLSPRLPCLISISSGDDASRVWYKKKRFTRLRGVALVVHGLNLKPERMGAVIRILNGAGLDVLNLSLRGHGINYQPISGLSAAEARLESFRRVSYVLWAGEIRDAYRQVRKRAEKKGVPVYFAGYSLGGLLGCDLLASDRDVSFHRMILFAPAVSIMVEAHLLKALTPFPNLVIDSLSPPFYRTNDGTPMAAYKALFEAIAHFEEQGTDRVNIPTLVFIDAKDEFIDGGKLAELVGKGLTQWRIVTLHRNEHDPGPQAFSHHLIIDEAGAGRDTWKRMTEDIRCHIRN